MTKSESATTEFTGAAVCALPECDRPAGGDLTVGPGVFFCSRGHRNTHIARKATRPRCPTCRGQFEPRGELGRRQVYCSSRCKSRRDRDLDQAARELARDAGTGDAREQLTRAEQLYATWCHDAGGADGFVGKRLAEQHWGDRVPPRLSPPSPKAAAALRKRINALRAGLAEADRARRRAEVRRAEAAAEAQLAQRRQAEAEDASAWRDELLSGSGRGGDDVG